jgi:hypothetical protein
MGTDDIRMLAGLRIFCYKQLTVHIARCACALMFALMFYARASYKLRFALRILLFL